MLIFSGSDRGLVRSNNEDYHRYDRDRQLILLADGVGGHPYGEVASRIAVEMAYQYLTQFDGVSSVDYEAELSKAFDFAHSKVVSQQNIKKAYEFMGTTLIAAWLVDEVLYFAWAGDSRLYLLNETDETLAQLTHDHTLLQELKNEGGVGQDYESSGSILTCMIGGKSGMKASTKSQKVKSGEMILVCSDGLSDILSKEEIQHLMQEHREKLSDLSMALIAGVYEKGARDNISTVVGLVP